MEELILLATKAIFTVGDIQNYPRLIQGFRIIEENYTHIKFMLYTGQ